MKNTAIITGASSGIGKELAIIHASKGGDLIIVARRKEKLDALATELKEKYDVNIEIIVADLSKANASQTIFDEVKSKNIDVDVLINNAGFGGQGYFHEREWQQDRNMIMVNIMALTELTRLILPEMLNRNKGRILHVGSTAGLLPGPLQSVYYATKAYVNSFSQGLAGELIDTNVTSTVLAPGATATEFGSSANLEKTKLFDAKLFDAKEVAEDGYAAMMQGELMCVTGVSFMQRMNLKMLPFVPTRMVLKQIKGLQETM